MLKNKKKVHDFMNAESSDETDIVPRKILKHKQDKEGYHFLLKFNDKTENWGTNNEAEIDCKENLLSYIKDNQLLSFTKKKLCTEPIQRFTRRI